MAKTKEVATEEWQVPALVEIKPDPFVQMVERLATNEAVDAVKLEKLVEIQMRIMDRNAESEFNIAMSEVQANIPQVAYDAANDQTRSRYARHQAIARAIKPVYTERGFSTTFSQADCPKDGYIRIAGILRHRAGHKEHHFVDLPVDKEGIKGNVNKTDLHAAGSTFTYGRRYLTCLMFDVATGEDDDGNAGADLTPINEQEQADLYAVATELFGNERAGRILYALAQQYFRLGDGDWHKIPAYRLGDAYKKLKEKAEKEAEKAQRKSQDIFDEGES